MQEARMYSEYIYIFTCAYANKNTYMDYKYIYTTYTHAAHMYSEYIYMYKYHTFTCIYISHVYTSDHIITCKLWAFCMHTRAQSRMHTRACKHNRTYALSLCLIHTPTLTYVYIHIDYTPAWEHFLFLSTCSQIAPFHYWDSPSNSSAVSLVVTWHAFRKQGIPLHELLHLPIRA